jgi:hypothetical protein
MEHEDNGNRDGKNDQEIAEHAVISHSSSVVRERSRLANGVPGHAT